MYLRYFALRSFFFRISHHHEKPAGLGREAGEKVGQEAADWMDVPILPAAVQFKRYVVLHFLMMNVQDARRVVPHNCTAKSD